MTNRRSTPHKKSPQHKKRQAAPVAKKYGDKTKNEEESGPARQFFEASQDVPLHDVLPEEVRDGEIIEIDDGLQPYYFYILDPATVVRLPYFRFPTANQESNSR